MQTNSFSSTIPTAQTEWYNRIYIVDRPGSHSVVQNLYTETNKIEQDRTCPNHHGVATLKRKIDGTFIKGGNEKLI